MGCPTARTGPTRRIASTLRPVRRWAAQVSILAVGCGQAAAPEAFDRKGAAIEPASVEPAVPTTEVSEAAVSIGSRAQPESWAFYPALDHALVDAFDRRARADRILQALADTLAPYRWATADDWDNTGFISTEPDGAQGFLTRAGDRWVPQMPGEAQLGCAGGYLEGVRAILVPDLQMSALRHCDADTLAALGEHAPPTCAPEGFGLHAIAATAAAAQASGATSMPPERIHLVPDGPESLAPLSRMGPVHVCTVSHRSRVDTGVRYHHHMMIVMRTGRPRALQVFDTTGHRGVGLREMAPRLLHGYLRSALASNRKHQYDPASTELDCFAITRRRD
jgi:hypothetical protein